MEEREIVRKAEKLFGNLEKMDLAERVQTINQIKIALHGVSPFKDEPVDCVIWEPVESVKANDYNPNAVAPPIFAFPINPLAPKPNSALAIHQIDSKAAPIGHIKNHLPMCDLPRGHR